VTVVHILYSPVMFVIYFISYMDWL